MYDFIKMVLAVIVGMFIYDRIGELLNLIRADKLSREYDYEARNKEWDKSWEKKWEDLDDTELDEDDEEKH